ncbi:MAG: hypothetical protein CR972_02175 [Candidatus Moraniibacteriota bacterium]|nr:MAG: hypothetical protein CR972_02175 [Candidatus Moranbacteria bacterium]
MTSTENLTKHIEALEEKRLSVFFHMQEIASELNGRLYNYNMYVGISAIIVLLSTLLFKDVDIFIVLWSKIFAIISMIIAFVQHLHVLDRNSTKMYENIRTIYKSYDDEYVVLRKFNSGEINEELIRQYYIDKSKELDRYSYNITTPDWFTWIALSLLIASIILLTLA